MCMYSIPKSMSTAMSSYFNRCLSHKPEGRQPVRGESVSNDQLHFFKVDSFLCHLISFYWQWFEHSSVAFTDDMVPCWMHVFCLGVTLS